MLVAMRCAPVLVGLAACGRIGFDVDPAGADGSTDGNSDGNASGLQPLHEYPLRANYDDLFGGPPLTSHGGDFVGNRYRFGAGQGLSVEGAMPRTVYTLDMMLSFDTLATWNKIVDFEDLGPDTGLYTYKSGLQFVIVPNADFLTTEPRFAIGSPRRLTTTRDATGTFTAYIDGVITFGERKSDPEPPVTFPTTAFTFVDSSSLAALSTDRVHFFMDDMATTDENAPGTVERIRIWDVALTQQQVAELQ